MKYHSYLANKVIEDISKVSWELITSSVPKDQVSLMYIGYVNIFQMRRVRRGMIDRWGRGRRSQPTWWSSSCFLGCWLPSSTGRAQWGVRWEGVRTILAWYMTVGPVSCIRCCRVCSHGRVLVLSRRRCDCGETHAIYERGTYSKCEQTCTMKDFEALLV